MIVTCPVCFSADALALGRLARSGSSCRSTVRRPAHGPATGRWRTGLGATSRTHRPRHKLGHVLRVPGSRPRVDWRRSRTRQRRWRLDHL